MSKGGEIMKFRHKYLKKLIKKWRIFWLSPTCCKCNKQIDPDKIQGVNDPCFIAIDPISFRRYKASWPRYYHQECRPYERKEKKCKESN